MPRYALVGCRDCDFLFITGTEHDHVTCRRCGTRYPLDRLRRFAEADRREAVVDARSAMLRKRVEEP